jgi:hypothetical protein
MTGHNEIIGCASWVIQAFGIFMRFVSSAALTLMSGADADGVRKWVLAYSKIIYR